MRSSRSRRCRCHSGRRAHRCCQPFHDGQPAPTPEALMRSRYAAYALGLVDYVMDTTTPGGPAHQDDRATWAAEIRAFSERGRFVGLRIEHAPPPRGDEGEVLFHAQITVDGQDAGFREQSRFVRREGRWTYWGALPDGASDRRTPSPEAR